MSLNPRETVPLAVLNGDEVGALPGPCFAIVCDPWNGPATSGAPPLFLGSGPGDLDASAGTGGERHALEEGQYQGIVLKPCRGLADLQAADVALGVIEAEAGLEHGTISIIAVLGISPASFLARAWPAGGSARLCALVFDESALVGAIGLPQTSGAHVPAPLATARGQIVLQAADAGVPVFWALPSRETDPQALARMRQVALSDGFTDVSVHGLAQWQALLDGEACHS
jgi:hypothetical protein